MKPALKTPRSIFLSWLVGFTFLPSLLLLLMSLMVNAPEGPSWSHWTFENYQRCFQWLYAKIFFKTFAFAAVTTLLCFLVGFPVAYTLAKTQGRYRRLGLILLFIPFWTNFILRIHAMISLLGNQGLLNQALQSLGVITEPLPLLYNRFGVFLGLLYNYLPFMVVPIYTSLEKLDPTLKEAAGDLGATRWQAFWRVTLPNVQAGILTGTLFVFIPMLGEYIIPDLLGGAKEAFLGNVMVSQFFTLQDWPFGSAIASLLALILLGLVLFQRRWNVPLLRKFA